MYEYQRHKLKKIIFFAGLGVIVAGAAIYLWFFKVSLYVQQTRQLYQLAQLDWSLAPTENRVHDADGKACYLDSDNPWIQKQLEKTPGLTYNPGGDGLGLVPMNADQSSDRLIAWFERPTELNTRVVLHSRGGRRAIPEAEFRSKFPWASAGDNSN
jgi:hypothetical protein